MNQDLGKKLKFYDSFSDEDEDSDYDWKTNLEDIYNTNKPPPILVDEKLYQIIYIPTVSNKPINENNSKLSKSQKKRLRRRLCKSKEISVDVLDSETTNGVNSGMISVETKMQQTEDTNTNGNNRLLEINLDKVCETNYDISISSNSDDAFCWTLRTKVKRSRNEKQKKWEKYFDQTGNRNNRIDETIQIDKFDLVVADNGFEFNLELERGNDKHSSESDCTQNCEKNETSENPIGLSKSQKKRQRRKLAKNTNKIAFYETASKDDKLFDEKINNNPVSAESTCFKMDKINEDVETESKDLSTNYILKLTKFQKRQMKRKSQSEQFSSKKNLSSTESSISQETHNKKKFKPAIASSHNSKEAAKQQNAKNGYQFWKRKNATTDTELNDVTHYNTLWAYVKPALSQNVSTVRKTKQQ